MSGLNVNYNKSMAVVIKGDLVDSVTVRHVIKCEIGEFPCKYLGLQLAVKRLTKAQWHSMLDHTLEFLPPWQRGLLERSGRLVLIKAVIMARPIHHLLIEEALVWLLEEVNKWARAFFWAGKEEANGGQCLVAWQKICGPLAFGGLGVKDLYQHGLALRVRWFWLKCTDPRRPWQELPMLDDKDAEVAFNSLVSITVGDGANTLFWRDRWLRGSSVGDIAPLVCAMVSNARASKRLVKDALLDHKWISNIRGSLSSEGLGQCLMLLSVVCTLIRDVEVPDRFVWPWLKSGQYTARSTYKALCWGAERMEGAGAISCSSAPLRCKLFAWLALQARLWTTERR
jgi:hypothetical protein